MEKGIRQFELGAKVLVTFHCIEKQEIVKIQKEGVVVQFGGVNPKLAMTPKGARYGMYLIELPNGHRMWVDHLHIENVKKLLQLKNHTTPNMLQLFAPDNATLHEVVAFLKTKYSVNEDVGTR
jgi:hypothetical protein